MKNRFVILILFLLSCEFLNAQVDSIVIINVGYIDFPDTGYTHQVDSFSSGIHVGQYKADNLWAPVSRTSYSWTGNLLIDSTTQVFSNNAWVYSTETLNQYDTNDSILTSNIYNFVYSSGVIYDTTITRSTYNRDTIANTLQILKEHWNNSTWTIISTTIDSFDTNGRLTYQQYSDTLPNYEYHFYYLSNDSVDYYMYRKMQGSSADTDSVVNSYLPSGYLDTVTTYNYHTFNGWTPNWMITYTYDNFNNMLSYCNHLWIDPFWDCFTDTVGMEYNSSNQLIHRTSYYCGLGGGSDYWYFYNPDGSPDSIYWHGWGSMGNDNVIFITFDYFPHFNSINEISDHIIQVFPNPAADKIFITSPFEILSVSLFNSIGGNVMTVESINENNFTIQLPDVPAGIYLVQARTENQTKFFKKLIIITPN